MSALSALVGAVVYCWFPDGQRPNEPGQKFRPGLVLDLDLKGKRIRIAYGTSQRPEQCREGEIMFRSTEIERLKKDTRFCLAKSKWIPLEPAYLSPSQKGNDVSIIGPIPSNRARDLHARLMEVAETLDA